MKRILIVFSALILSGGLLFAQEDMPEIPEEYISGTADRFMVDLFTDIWSNAPEEMDMNTINRGISISMMQDFKLGASPFSVAAGLGISSHNLYSNFVYEFTPMSWSSAWPQPGTYDFHKIDEEFYEIKKNKLSLNYLSAPFEFRYRNYNLPKTFRIYAGLRLGYLINAHTKTHLKIEEGVVGSPPPSEWKTKESKLGNLEKFQVGVTARVGYGRINLFGYLPLTEIFKDNFAAGQGMKPVSVGLTFIVF
ncbi:MAG: outer membrane beta-barrel protein [Bacteroides sp.]|jgi:hypothetical protein|nr:outer membrane beta-barrel protein [Bacteroides sp.]